MNCRAPMHRVLAVTLFLLGMLVLKAHEPFDLSSQIVVSSDRLELTSTAGVDAAERLLANGGVAPDEVKRSLRTVTPDTFIEQPVQVADYLLKLQHESGTLSPRKVTTRSEGLEIFFTVIYDRPAAGGLLIEAVCYQAIPDLRTGALVIADESGKVMGSALVSKANARLRVNLPPRESVPETISEKPAAGSVENETSVSREPPVPTAVSDAPPQPGFRAFFALGVEHILMGIDHLLFLAALLIAVRRLKIMIAIITCFTVGHSVTLAAAALGVMTISPRVIEPLIAFSIMVVCVMNFLRRDNEGDRPWLAGGFGLIHGFGFASVLQASGLGSGGYVVPLLAFNLGVEAGQLAVAVVFLPLLFAVRKWSGWPRYGFPAVTGALMLASAYWCFERLL